MASNEDGKRNNVIRVDFAARARQSAAPDIHAPRFFTQSQLNGLRHFYEIGRRAGVFSRMDYEQGAQSGTVRFYAKNGGAQPCLKIVRSYAPRLIRGEGSDYYHHVYKNSGTSGAVLIAQDEQFTPCIKAMRHYMASFAAPARGQLLQYHPR